MATLQTKYLGLTLQSPIIIGSSELTNNIENIIKFEQYGAGAVVLKSLFEEQINIDAYKTLKTEEIYAYPEAADYIRGYTETHSVNKYLDLIKEAKAKVKMPIIASINCISGHQWTGFAKKIQDAGADALELNIFLSPSDFSKSADDYEKMYFDIITEVKKHITIPIALKISYHFSAMAQFIQKISWTGVKGIVLFNRFFHPDFDIDNFKVISSFIYSCEGEIALSLKWIGILSGSVESDFCASTGVHNGKSVIKQLLAGAKAVQVCSAIYQKGPEYVKTMLEEVEAWMKKHNFNNIEDFRGRMSFEKADNPAAYERVQFMRYHAGI